MNLKTFFLTVIFSVYTLSGWGQTEYLTETMTATLDAKGVLTISTTADAEAMPDLWQLNMWADDILAIIIEDKVTTIGSNAFNYCHNLTSVTISNSVTKIGERAFYECNKLPSITIPASVTEIGQNAFVSEMLSEVTVAWMTPLSVPELIFGEYPPSKLHVPLDTKALYEADPVWGRFKTIDEYDLTGNENIHTPTLKAYASNGILSISGLQPNKPLYVFNLSGQLVYKGVAKAEKEFVPLAARGIYIVVAGEQTVKVITN